MPNENVSQIALRARRFITSGIFELQFAKPASFSFLAGQFVRFKIPHSDSFVWRSYSIASHPSEPDLLFCVKDLVDGKAPAHFKRMMIGDNVVISQPAGYFCLRNGGKPKIFIATGTGLAPTRALVRESLQRNAATQLLFGVRREEDIFWEDERVALQKQFPRFMYTVTLSQPTAGWRGAIGRVTAHLPHHINQQAEYYVCGSGEMVKQVRDQLIKKDIATEFMHFEIF